MTRTLMLDGLGAVEFCHATPDSDTSICTRVTTDDRMATLFASSAADTVVCGHTHMAYDRTVGSRRIVNAGSVGMPFASTARVPGLCRGIGHGARARRSRCADGAPRADRYDYGRRVVLVCLRVSPRGVCTVRARSVTPSLRETEPFTARTVLPASFVVCDARSRPVSVLVIVPVVV